VRIQERALIVRGREVRGPEEWTGAVGERGIVFGADRELEEVSSQI
jgi:hypothetical protein